MAFCRIRSRGRGRSIPHATAIFKCAADFSSVQMKWRGETFGIETLFFVQCGQQSQIWRKTGITKNWWMGREQSLRNKPDKAKDVEMRTMFQRNWNKIKLGSIKCNMTIGDLRRDMATTGILRYTRNTKVTIDVDVCRARSIVRSKTMENGDIGKIIDWGWCIEQHNH